MDRLLNVMSIFSLLMAGWVLASLRRAHIRVEYSVSWLAAAVVLLVLSRWHALQDWVAAAVGVNDTSLAVLMAGGAVFLVVLYRFSLIISRLKDSNIALTQRLAILEFRLNSFDPHPDGRTEAR
jgi:hypothetical protein